MKLFNQFNQLNQFKRLIAGILTVVFLAPTITIAQSNIVNSIGSINSSVITFGSKNQPSFVNNLQTSLIPQRATGSGTPTFTRASTAYVFGYGPTAVLGVDVPVALLLNSGEAGFVGARRISANNWSGTDANGVALTTTNGASAVYGDANGPFGYFSGGARADVLGTTAAIRRTMTDVGWVCTNITVTTTTGIDGTAASGARLTATGANGTCLFTPGLAGAVRTYSNWCKRITGTGAFSLTPDIADGYTVKTLTTAYAQNQVTSSSAVPVVGVKIATSGDVVDCDFNTLEAATFANPTPIPVNVSKAADVLTYVSAGNISKAVSSLYLESYNPVSGTFLLTTDDTALYGLYITGAGSFPRLIDTASNTITSATAVTSIMNKLGASWGGTAMALVHNAVDAGSGTFNGNFGNGIALNIGHSNSANQPFGTIRNVRIYPVALPSYLLQQKTTDATDWLGDPWWRMAANDNYYHIAVNS